MLRARRPMIIEGSAAGEEGEGEEEEEGAAKKSGDIGHPSPGGGRR